MSSKRKASTDEQCQENKKRKYSDESVNSNFGGLSVSDCVSVAVEDEAKSRPEASSSCENTATNKENKREIIISCENVVSNKESKIKAFRSFENIVNKKESELEASSSYESTESNDESKLDASTSCESTNLNKESKQEASRSCESTESIDESKLDASRSCESTDRNKDSKEASKLCKSNDESKIDASTSCESTDSNEKSKQEASRSCESTESIDESKLDASRSCESTDNNKESQLESSRSCESIISNKEKEIDCSAVCIKFVPVETKSNVYRKKSNQDVRSNISSSPPLNRGCKRKLDTDETNESQKMVCREHEQSACTENCKELLNENPSENVCSTSPFIKDNSVNFNTKIRSNAIRVRKKHIINKLQTQLEFYLSRANLVKDAFLRQHLDEDSYVPLSVFLSFNKIKTLTNELSLLKYAILNSSLLKLSSDGTKVKSTLAVQEKSDVSECTLYVDNLARGQTIDQIKEHFSQYGSVEYVSLPVYKDTKKSRGFAFVEFDSPNSVKNALIAYGSLPTDSDLFEEFSNKNDAVNSISKTEHKKSSCTNSTKQIASQSSVTDLKKREDDCGQDRSSIDRNFTTNSKRKNHRRKSRRQKNHRKELEFQKKLTEDYSQLVVMSKVQWKKMRDEYVCEQKKVLGECKKLLREKTGCSDHLENENSSKSRKERVKPVMIPGSVVKIDLEKPLEEVDSMLEAIKSTSEEIAFIEAMNGCSCIYVRFKCRSAALLFCADTIWWGRTRVLQDEEEKNYWEKIYRLWQDRIISPQTRKKKRGKQTLLARWGKKLADQANFNN